MRDNEPSRFDAALAQGGYAPAFPAAAPDLAEPVPPPRRRRWRRIALLVLGLFLALFLWLAITAPLSRSLEPVAAPTGTLLSAGGNPIPRRGAIVDQPVDVTR